MKQIGFLLFVQILLFAQPASAQQRVRVYAPANNSDTVEQLISILKTELNKATSVSIERLNETDYNGQGILLSSGAQARKRYATSLAKLGPEAVSIHNTKTGISIIGNSQVAVQHGLFIYLEKLGFRYYFPHPDWYIAPTIKNLYPAINYTAEPSFAHRRIWYAYATGSKIADENYQFWFKANRLGGALQAYVGHAYDDIVLRNKEEFARHPNWFYPAVKAGTLPDHDPKFDLSNESLINFVTADVMKRLDKAAANHTPIRMISVSPSDGLIGSCNTPACQQLGTITDRVYYLINRVAREVRSKYPGTWISGMAYADYSAPPTKKLEPNTFVSIATAFNNTSFSTEDLIREWSKKAGKVGVYDYLGLYVWDLDMPGQGQASNVDMVVSKVKKYYKLGARGYDAETTPGSINKGLGHYLVSRCLWDANSNTAAAKKEFFTLCFGKASGIMKGLWDEWENYPYNLVRESDLASWIDLLQQAERTEQDPLVQKRFTHIYQYLHYIHLYNLYKNSESEADLLSLMVYCYNTNDWGAISGYPAVWVLGNAAKFPGMKYGDANAKFKKSEPQFSNRNYIEQLVLADRKQLRKQRDIKKLSLGSSFTISSKIPAIFSENKYSNGKNTTAFTGSHNFLFQLNNSSTNNYLELAAGLNLGNNNDRPLTISIYPYQNSSEETGSPIITFDYSAHKDTQRISLAKLKPALYLVKVAAAGKRFSIDFSKSIGYAVIVTPKDKFDGYTRYLSFYVPPGTSSFRVFKQIAATIVSPTGRVIDMPQGKTTDETEVDVKASEEGFWLISFLSGKIHIEGIPPYLGMNPSQMLIPK